MTNVMNNVPNVRNNKKGILKNNKEEEKSRSKSENNPTAMKQIHPAHESFNMVFNIMLGIKKSVDSTLDIPMLHATDKDFNLKC